MIIKTDFVFTDIKLHFYIKNKGHYFKTPLKTQTCSTCFHMTLGKYAGLFVIDFKAS